MPLAIVLSIALVATGICTPNVRDAPYEWEVVSTIAPIQTWFSEYTPSLKETLKFEIQANQTGQRGEGGDDDECLKCWKGSAEWVVKDAADQWKKKCTNTKCPFIKKHCEESEKWPKVALGMLMELSEPVRTGLAYCVGQDRCKDKWDDKTIMGNAPGIDENMLPRMEKYVARLYGDHTPMERKVDESRGGGFNSAVFAGMEDQIEEWRSEAVARVRATPNDNESSMDEHPTRTMTDLCTPGTPQCDKCVKCVKKVSYDAMKYVIDKFHHVCDQKKCKELEQVCKLASDYPQETYGFLLGKMQPWKYGYGFCRGAKICEEKRSNSWDSPSLRHGHHEGILEA